MYEWWAEKTDWRVSEIFRAITNAETKFSNDKYFKNYIIVVTGKGGRTGKTYLCDLLNNAGFKAIELAEDLNMLGLVNFKDDYNHVLVSNYSNVVLVVLNKYIAREKGEEKYGRCKTITT